MTDGLTDDEWRMVEKAGRSALAGYLRDWPVLHQAFRKLGMRCHGATYRPEMKRLAIRALADRKRRVRERERYAGMHCRCPTCGGGYILTDPGEVDFIPGRAFVDLSLSTCKGCDWKGARHDLGPSEQAKALMDVDEIDSSPPT